MKPKQREFLRQHADAKGWYLYEHPWQEMIDNLTDDGYLAPTGSFKLVESTRKEVIGVVGVDIPVMGTLVSYYFLTPLGKQFLDDPSLEG